MSGEISVKWIEELPYSELITGGTNEKNGVNTFYTS